MTDSPTDAVMSDTFNFWEHLPKELKLRILDYLLLFGRSRGLTHHTHAYYSKMGMLVPLLLTSKSMCALALRSHYTNGVILGDCDSESLKVPRLSMSTFVRKVEIQFSILHRKWKRDEGWYANGSGYWDHRNLSRLIQETKSKKWTDPLQKALCSMEHLKLNVNIMRGGKERPHERDSRKWRRVESCLQGNEDVLRKLENTRLALRPETVSVLVQGFECGGFGNREGHHQDQSTCPLRCAEKVAIAVKSMVHLKSSDNSKECPFQSMSKEEGKQDWLEWLRRG